VHSSITIRSIVLATPSTRIAVTHARGYALNLLIDHLSYIG
jgi:hypothetical protein